MTLIKYRPVKRFNIKHKIVSSNSTTIFCYKMSSKIKNKGLLRACQINGIV